MNGENELYELPKGWVWTTLGEISLNPQYGWTTKAKKQGTLHLLRTSDITSHKLNWDLVPFCEKEPPDKDKYLLEDGDIVISRAGSVGHSYLIRNPQEAIFASYLIRFKPLNVGSYISKFLKSPFYWEIISEKSIGIALPNVNAKKLKKIPIPLPPLQEQQRIVSKIEELFTNIDAGISALIQTKTQLKNYRQSLLKYAFEGKLTEEWRKIHKNELEPASTLLEKIKEEQKKEGKRKKRKNKDNSVDDSDLYELPEVWVWVQVDQLYDIIGGGTPSTKIEEYWGGDIPWITSQDIYGLKDIKIRKWITREAIEKSTTKPVPKNSILVVTRVGLGKIALTENLICFNQDIQALIDNTRLLYPFYSLYCLSKKIQIFRYKHRGTTVGGVTKKQLAKLSFPLPPLKEQQQIVEILDQQFSIIDELEKTTEINLKKAERLRQSILKKAFKGKLVPQDPSDEPAHLLLERIKEQKEREKSDKRKSKKNTFDSDQTRLIDYDK